jgi:hypothetical protein
VLAVTIVEQERERGKSFSFQIVPLRMNFIIFFRLPTDLFHLIQCYLKRLEYIRLVNSCRKLVNEVKRHSAHYGLNQTDSEEFLYNEQFRKLIVSKVRDPKLQLSLSILFQVSSLPVAHLNNVPLCSLSLINSRNYTIPVESFTQVHVLSIENGDFNSFPLLSSLQSLSLHNCRNLIDVSNLSHLKKLSLSLCHTIVNISPLQSISELSITSCPRVIDFQSLKNRSFSLIDNLSLKAISFRVNPHHVVLSKCHEWFDLAPLKSIHSLVFIDCDQVFDLSPLTENIALTISFSHRENDNYHLKGYESLCKLKKLKLVGCNLVDLNCFQRLEEGQFEFCHHLREVSLPNPSLIKKIEFYDCRLFSSITGLKEAKIVNINNCLQLSNISGLGRNQRVKIGSSDKIKDFSSLRSVTDVHIYNCGHFMGLEGKFSDVPLTVRCLTIDLCNQFKETSGLSSLEYFSVISCYYLISLDGLKDVSTVCAKKCRHLKNVSGLGPNNRRVVLDSCPEIADLTALKAVKDLRIVNCKRIRPMVIVELEESHPG